MKKMTQWTAVVAGAVLAVAAMFPSHPEQSDE